MTKCFYKDNGKCRRSGCDNYSKDVKDEVCRNCAFYREDSE